MSGLKLSVFLAIAWLVHVSFSYHKSYSQVADRRNIKQNIKSRSRSVRPLFSVEVAKECVNSIHTILGDLRSISCLEIESGLHPTETVATSNIFGQLLNLVAIGATFVVALRYSRYLSLNPVKSSDEDDEGFEFDDSNSNSCPLCNGSGQITIENNELISCDLCYGTGRVDPSIKLSRHNSRLLPSSQRGRKNIFPSSSSPNENNPLFDSDDL